MPNCPDCERSSSTSPAASEMYSRFASHDSCRTGPLRSRGLNRRPTLCHREVGPADEPDLGIEVRLDHDAVDARSRSGRRRNRTARDSWRRRREEPGDEVRAQYRFASMLSKKRRSASRPAVPPLSPLPEPPGQRPVAIMPTLLRRRMLRRRRSAENVVATAPADGLVVRGDGQRADVERAGLAGDAPAGDDRHRLPVAQADPAAEEQDRNRARPLARLAAEIEDPLSLEKEVALLGEEQAESREVDLLLVFLDLREVGVDREVGGQAAGQPVLHVDADVAPEVVAEGNARRAIGRQRRRPRTA